MNPLQLELLISGYLDDELSPNRKLEVKNLLQSDPAANKLYEDLMSIRNEIRKVRHHNLPFDFQKRLFERIDRETVALSGKFVEKTTSVDFTQSAVADAQSEWQTRATTIKAKHWHSVLLERGLKNPGVWVVPVVALVIGFAVFAFYPKDREVAVIPQPPPSVDVVPSSSSNGLPYYPPPALSADGGIPENTSNHGLSYSKDGKPIVEVMLKLSPAARDSQYIPKLLADCGYSYLIRENGNKSVTVYEFEMPADKLFPLLTLMYHSKRDEILEYKFPDGILTLLHRPVEPGLMEPTTETSIAESTIIVRLNATR